MPDRIAVTPGNLGQPFLGLSIAEFVKLAHDISVIYHNGALVHSLLPPSRLQATNVNSTLWLIKLATTSRTKELHYISSESVGQGAESAYAESKRRSEDIVRGAVARNVQANIFRIPRLAPDSRTGIPNEKDIFVRLIDIILRTGTAPDIELNETWIPVDIAARVLVGTAQRSHGGEEFSLAPPGHVSFEYLLDVARENGFHIKVEPLKHWIARLKETNSVEFELTLSALGLDDTAHAGTTSDRVQHRHRSDLKVVAAPGVDRATLGRYFQRIGSSMAQ